jgi:hypothetical protein
LGLVVIKDVLARIEGEYIMDKPPAMEGRFMSMVLSPKAKSGKQPVKQAAESTGGVADSAVGGTVGRGQEEPKQSSQEERKDV